MKKIISTTSLLVAAYMLLPGAVMAGSHSGNDMQKILDKLEYLQNKVEAQQNLNLVLVCS